MGFFYKYTVGYDNMNKHLERHHAAEIGLDTTQTQMVRYTSFSGGTISLDLFKYSDAKNRE